MTTQRLHLPSDKRAILFCILLFAVVLWVFLPSTQNGFVNYDDDVYVTANFTVQQGLTATGIAWAFQSTDASNWHPFTWLSHMLDYQLYGLMPWGHHLTSVLLHAANAVLLFLVLRRMTGATWRSLFVAAVFGLHPLRVESVAWVSERKDVISTFFWLLTVLAYARYANESEISGLKSKVFYGLALVLFAFGLMSKPMLVTLPFTLLLLDYWPLARWPQSGPWRLAREKWPFFALAAASCAITFHAQRQGGAMVLMAGLPLGARVENALVSYARYLGKFFRPENLAVVYPVQESWPTQMVVPATVLLLGITLLAAIASRRQPYLAVGWFWFVGTLVPVIGLVAVGEQSMADRYTYVPMIGLLVALTWGAYELSQPLQFRAVILSVASAVALAFCIALTRENIAHWRNSETLFQHALVATTNNYSAHVSLGSAFLAEGRLDEALVEFQEAIKLKPDSAETRNNVGVVLGAMGRMEEAIPEFEKAARLNPNYAEAHSNLGKALDRLGLSSEAMAAYHEALRLKPDSSDLHNCLGIALAKSDRLDEAVKEFQTAVNLNPTNAAAWSNWNKALELKGR